ncbi:MAG: hypothetical protein N3G75_06340 [Methanothrix sp.]|nr:hypothetical protein [Methanothrix sp.]MCX8207434.1 hypothetical protein [Methanothrix sp.]
MTLSIQQKQKVITRLPLSIPKTEFNQYVNFPAIPCVVFSLISEGARTHYFRDLIRSRRNAGFEYDDWIGHISRATLSLTILSFDPLESRELAHQMELELWQNRLGLVKPDDGIWMTRVLRSAELPAIRSELHKKLLHRWNIDIELEYEVSWKLIAPTIKAFGVDVDGLKLELTAPGCYGASIVIKK